MYLFKKLMQDLSSCTGLSIEVNEKHSVFLEYDNFIITLQYRENQNDIVIFTPVSDPYKNAELDERTLRNALKLCYNGEGTNGCFLGLFQESLVLSKIIAIQGLSAEALSEIIAQFAITSVQVYNNLIISLINDSSHKEIDKSCENGIIDTQNNIFA